jgi:hypothetical protein
MDNFKLYNFTNSIGDTIGTIPNKLEQEEKEKIIFEFENLHWDDLDNYYKISERTNLLSIYFVCWKIIKILEKKNIKLKNKIEFDKIKLSKLNNSTQNMLWEILNPDELELS